MHESGIPTMFVELQRTETENFARNCAGFACFSETADTAQVSGTVGWVRTTDLRIHNPAL